jgi:hypothetical protein
MDPVDLVDQTLIREIFLNYAVVVFMDQDRQDLIFLIYFTRVIVITRQAFPHVYAKYKYTKLPRSLRAV